MAIYLIPDQGQMDEVSAQCSKAQIPLLNPKKVRDYILSTNGVPIAVCVVSENVMLVLTRHATTLFEGELPLVLHDVPGIVYHQGWMSMGTAFPPANWVEFEKATAKSGHMATTPETLEKRGLGASVSNEDDFYSRLAGKAPSDQFARAALESEGEMGLG